MPPLIDICSLFVFEIVFVFVVVPVCLILKPTWRDARAVLENTLVFVFFLCVCLCVCLCLFYINISNLTSCSCCCGEHSNLCVCVCLFLRVCLVFVFAFLISIFNISNLTSCSCCCGERSCGNQAALPSKKRHFSEIIFSKTMEKCVYLNQQCCCSLLYVSLISPIIVGYQFPSCKGTSAISFAR